MSDEKYAEPVVGALIFNEDNKIFLQFTFANKHDCEKFSSKWNKASITVNHSISTVMSEIPAQMTVSI